MYSLSSFLRSEVVSLLLALVMMEAMALWQREGMSSILGGSVSWRISVAVDSVFVRRCGSVVGGGACVDFGSMLWLVFLSLVIRLSCRVSDFVMGG